MLKVLEVAFSYEGWTENNGDNVNPFAEYLDGIDGFYNGTKNGFAYCDIFVDACMVKAYGLDTALKLLCQPMNSLGAGCTYSARYYMQAGRFFTTSPQVGDQIFFGSGSECTHTGLVYDVSGGYVLTIEGNTSDGVFRRCYSLDYSQIYGYGRPDYSIVGAAAESGGAAVSGEAGITEEKEVKIKELSRGCTGYDVKVMQTLLVLAGNDVGEDGADGDFGANTEAALKAFQEARGLEVDGVCGVNSWTRLIRG